MKTHTSYRTSTAGFTLTEILVTFIIIVILASLTFMGVRHAMESARIGKSMFHLKDLGSIFATYAAEYGHYPPGWDNSYGRGPVDSEGVRMSGRGPDIVNAFLEMKTINERWISPNLEAKLIAYNGTNQPTNYSGHPALCYNGSDQPEPLPSSVVSRPHEVFLLCDGVPKSDDDSLNSQTSIRQWYAISQSTDSRSFNSSLPVKPSTGKERNGPDFRNRGKCHVVFCDGHVEAFAPGDFKQKHVALRY